jgi:hypothetical protein
MDGNLQFLFPQKSMCKETRQFFNVCMHNGPVCMKLLRNDIHNLSHVRIKIYREFYHDIFYIANEGRQIFFQYIFYLIRSKSVQQIINCI